MGSLKKKGVQITIQPFDAATNKAVQIINQKDPSLLKGVVRIVIHSGGGNALGHVEMGPGKNPQEIHIHKDRVRDAVMRNANVTIKKTLTPQELEQAIVNSLVEVLSHESGHIGGKTRTPEQITKGPFFGEGQAEQTAKEFMSKVKPANKNLSLSKRSDKVREDKNVWRPGVKNIWKGIYDKYEDPVKHMREDSPTVILPHNIPDFDVVEKGLETPQRIIITNKNMEPSDKKGKYYVFGPDAEFLNKYNTKEKAILNANKSKWAINIIFYEKDITDPEDAIIMGEFVWSKPKNYSEDLLKSYVEGPFWVKDYWGRRIASYDNKEQAIRNAENNMYIQSVIFQPVGGKEKDEQIIWEKPIQEQVSKVKANRKFFLSKRAKIEMACPYCQEDVSNLTPQKDPAGLYKMLTCPNCNKGFYPQDAALAVKKHEKELDVGNWIEKGWWMILGGEWALGFVDSEAKANLIKDSLIKRFTEQGVEGLKHNHELYYYIITMTQHTAGGLGANILVGPAPREIYGPYEENPEIIKYDKAYSNIHNETAEDIGSILTGTGDFQKKKRKDYIEKILNITKAPSNYQPPKEAIVSGTIPTRENSNNAMDDVLEEPELNKARRENSRKAKNETRELVEGPVQSAIKRIKIKEKGLDPTKFCDDAKTASKKKVDEFILNAVLTLNEIQEKFFPNTQVEPNLKFATYAPNKEKAIRYAVSLIKETTTPLIPAIKEAAEYNRKTLKNQSNIKLYNKFPIHFDDYELVISLCKWQDNNKLEITGKLDKETIKKLSTSFNSKIYPRNFAMVVPGLYRGGQIADEGQLKALKDLGVERVVSLHDNPNIERLCNNGGLEYVPAFIENGEENDLGRQLFGNSVSKYLMMKPTYVCCFFGKDRTGGVIGKFRIENGWNSDLVYREMKAFGFSDLFVDILDWVFETCKNKPVDTNKIRKAMGNKKPYENPEITTKEQDCWSPLPHPNDVSFPIAEGIGGGPQYLSYSDYITSEVPTSMTVPLSITSNFKNAYEVRDVEEEKRREERYEDEGEDIVVNINGLWEDEVGISMNQGWAEMPIFDTTNTAN